MPLALVPIPLVVVAAPLSYELALELEVPVATLVSLSATALEQLMAVMSRSLQAKPRLLQRLVVRSVSLVVREAWRRVERAVTFAL